MVEGRLRGRRELAEIEKVEDVAGMEDAELLVLLHLHEYLKESFFREEEEAQPRRLDGCVGVARGDHRDLLHRDCDMAGVCETELLEEDHGPGVGIYG